MEKISGYVKTWQSDKGFGFIELKVKMMFLSIFQLFKHQKYVI